MATAMTDAPALPSDMDRYLFDLRGFVVVKNVFCAEEIAQANAAIDRHSSEFVERVNEKVRLAPKGSPLAGDGVTGREDLGGVLQWDPNDASIFRRMLTHPKLLPYYRTLLGDGFRMDHHPIVIQQRPGAEGFALHGGNTDAKGQWIPELAYTYAQGAMRCNLLAVSLQLTDVAAGDGGFCIVPGSHKANFPCPKSVITGEALADELLHQPVTSAGDVVLFTEAASHGTLPWKAQRKTRRVAIYRFAPSFVAYSRSYYPEWPALKGDQTPAEQAVLGPPYHTRLDRPCVDDDGSEASVHLPRDLEKVAHDTKVFGTPYF